MCAVTGGEGLTVMLCRAHGNWYNDPAVKLRRAEVDGTIAAVTLLVHVILDGSRCQAVCRRCLWPCCHYRVAGGISGIPEFWRCHDAHTIFSRRCCLLRVSRSQRAGSVPHHCEISYRVALPASWKSGPAMGV